MLILWFSLCRLLSVPGSQVVDGSYLLSAGRNNLNFAQNPLLRKNRINVCSWVCDKCNFDNVWSHIQCRWVRVTELWVYLFLCLSYLSPRVCLHPCLLSLHPSYYMSLPLFLCLSYSVILLTECAITWSTGWSILVLCGAVGVIFQR